MGSGVGEGGGEVEAALGPVSLVALEAGQGDQLAAFPVRGGGGEWLLD